MPFVDLGKGYDAVKEAELAPEDEYDLVIRDVKHNAEKGFLQCLIDFEGEDYKIMYHTLWLPDPEKDAARDDEYGNDKGTTLKNKQLAIKRFCHAFEIEIGKDGLDTDAMKGMTSRRKVVQDISEGRDGNTYRNNKVIIPSLPGE